MRRRRRRCGGPGRRSERLAALDGRRSVVVTQPKIERAELADAVQPEAREDVVELDELVEEVARLLGILQAGDRSHTTVGELVLVEAHQCDTRGRVRGTIDRHALREPRAAGLRLGRRRVTQVAVNAHRRAKPLHELAKPPELVAERVAIEPRRASPISSFAVLGGHVDARGAGAEIRFPEFPSARSRVLPVDNNRGLRIR